jgi:glycosyltransferase involved in cell wall biosynthesis
LSSPPVTIVTPSYNQGEFIRATIDSVLSQDYQNLEYIVMDGGSTDETASILAEYASRLTWISEKDRGQAHAINKGFAQARGEIVAWINSDDVYLPGAISRAVAEFERLPCAAVVYGDGFLIDREGRPTGRFQVEPFNLWRLSYLSDYVLQQSTFFRKNAIEAIGGLDETLHYTLDWDLLIRLGKRFGLHHLKEDLAMLREYSDAKTFSGGVERVWEIRRVLERHTGLRYAPGFWTYRFDTVQRRWKRRIDGMPRWLRLPARGIQLFVYVPTAAAMMFILRYSQGLSSDWSASNRMKWMLPEGNGEIVIRGSVPDDRRLRGAVLAAVAGERQLGSWRLGPGDFEVRFHAPEHHGTLQFELRCSRRRWRFSPATVHLRKESFLLKSAEWARSNDAVD